jgi:hypothetical protein
MKPSHPMKTSSPEVAAERRQCRHSGAMYHTTARGRDAGEPPTNSNDIHVGVHGDGLDRKQWHVASSHP